MQRLKGTFAEVEDKFKTNRLSHKLLVEEEDSLKLTLNNIRRAAAAAENKGSGDTDSVVVVSDDDSDRD